MKTEMERHKPASRRRPRILRLLVLVVAKMPDYNELGLVPEAAHRSRATWTGWRLVIIIVPFVIYHLSSSLL
jgi:hypothetical protein